MTARAPIFTQQGSFSAEDVRLSLISAMMGPPTLTAAALTRPGGVIPGLGGSLAVTATGTAGVLQVASGGATVAGKGGLQGNYMALNDADQLLPALAPADISNDRIDLIVAHIRDRAVLDDTEGLAYEIVQGQPNANPIAPAVPDNAIALFEARSVKNSTTVTLLDRRKWAVGVGGIMPVNNGERPANPFSGMAIVEIQSGFEYRWHAAGARWRRVVNEDEVGLGQVVVGNQSGPATVPSGSALLVEVPGMAVQSFPFQANRRYRIEATAQISVGASGYAARLVITDGVDVNFPGSTGAYAAAYAGLVRVHNVFYYEPGSATQVKTVKSQIGTAGTSASSSSSSGGWLRIFDEGRV